MMPARLVLGAAGLAIGLYGVWLLYEFPVEVIVRIALWAVAGVVLHDFVFAPIGLAVGAGGRRWLPRWWQGPLGVGLLCSAVLVLLAIPVFDRPGARPDNTTVLDRDYPWGLWVALGVVWTGVVVVTLGRKLLPVRHDQVVDQESPDDVDTKPPPV